MVSALRAAQHTPSTSSSTASSATRRSYPSSTNRAARNSSSPDRPPHTESSADARSVISAVWLMSPKSMIPVMSPSSSVSVLSTVRSVWTTCARSRGQTGVTRRSNSSTTRSTAARVEASVTSGSISRALSACWTSHGITRTARGWVKLRIATPSRAVVSPHALKAASESSVALIRLLPGRTS